MIITITNLRAQTLLGAYPEERHALREVILNIEIETDASKAAASDNLIDALDYAKIEEEIVQSLMQQTFNLLESLAAHVATLIMQHPAASNVSVTIAKPGALKYADCVAITHKVKR